MNERPCRCGGTLKPAVRYETQPMRTVDVRCCFDCGAEQPPLYRRHREQRNGEPYAQQAWCQWCGRSFSRVARRKPLYCNHSCMGRALAARVKRKGRAA